MHLTNKNYVPTLAIRPSEMNGLEYLPGQSKDAMTPVFLLAPWANSKTILQAVARAQRSYPGRQFILDVDRDYYPSNPEGSQAQAEWLELRNPSNRFDAWYRLWTSIPEAVPCLQLEGQSAEDLRLQINDIQLEGREFALRIELNRRHRNMAEAVSVLSDLGTADFSVIIDGGWVTDALTLSARMGGLINGILAPLDGRIPVVVSCTSMLKGFSEISGIETIPFSNRQLVGQLARNTNRERIVYGDWGSTRPREDAFGRTPLPRIDYAIDDAWLIARDSEAPWSFQDAARAIIQDRNWSGQLGIWGE